MELDLQEGYGDIPVAPTLDFFLTHQNQIKKPQGYSFFSFKKLKYFNNILFGRKEKKPRLKPYLEDTAL
jgi:hypothetical protein